MFLRPTKQTWIISIVAMLVIVAMLSCKSTDDTAPKASLVGRQITDDAGRRVALPPSVDRVVSLAPNLTEIVFAVGGGSSVVGNTTYCDFPEQAKSVVKVGDTLHPSIERIIALKPEVVLVSTASQLEVFTEQLKNHNISVFVTDPHDLEGVFRSITQVGEILGRANEANAVVEKLRQRTNTVETAVKQLPRVRIFYQLSAEPLYTAGRDSFVTDLIKRAGGDSVTADVPGAWPKYSAESALAAKPDAIVLPTGGSMGAGNVTVAEALRQSPAVLQGRVYKINDDHLVRPGPRAVDGLEAMAKALHPEAFNR